MADNVYQTLQRPIVLDRAQLAALLAAQVAGGLLAYGFKNEPTGPETAKRLALLSVAVATAILAEVEKPE